MKNLIVDLDGTLTILNTGDYENVLPNLKMIDKLNEYKNDGYSITIFTARNMKTFNNNIGKINVFTLPNILNWLKKYNIPYDEVIVGKPWCGTDGFYIDDKAIRPDEFITKTKKEIDILINKE